jgi:hypothetical protein
MFIWLVRQHQNWDIYAKAWRCMHQVSSEIFGYRSPGWPLLGYVQ